MQRGRRRIGAVTLAVLFVLAAYGLASAAAEEKKQEVVRQDQPSAGQQVDAAIESYRQTKGITFGSEMPDGRIYYMAKAPVNVDPANSQWGKARSLAFDKAMLLAHTDFVRDMWGRQAVKVSHQISRDDSDGAEDFSSLEKTRGRMMALYEKTIAFFGAKLDRKLEEVGVDPAKYAATAPELRKKLFMDSFIRTTMTKAIGDMAGLMPIQTFEGIDESGTHVIGVIVLYSPSLKQLAEDISRGRAPMPRTVGKPIASVIPVEGAALSSEFGVRVLFDEQGQPNLVSFGQWSTSYNGTSGSKRARDMQHGADVALENANAAMTIFLNGRLMYEDNREVGEIVEESLRKSGDGMITRDNLVQIIDRMNSSLRLEAHADLAGRFTLRKWTYQHPYGHDLVGVVQVWNLAMLDSSDMVRNRGIRSSSGQGAAPAMEMRFSPGVQTGKDYIETKDF